MLHTGYPICYDLPLLATIRDYSRLFATIRTIRTIRCSLFGIIRFSLFATVRGSIFGFSRHPSVTNLEHRKLKLEFLAKLSLFSCQPPPGISKEFDNKVDNLIINQVGKKTLPWRVYSSQEPIHYRVHTMEHNNQPAMFHPSFSPRPKTGMFRASAVQLRVSGCSGMRRTVCFISQVDSKLTQNLS